MPLEVSVYVGRGEHRWDGSPIYLDSPAERHWGASCLKLDKDSLRLGLGEEDVVIATVGDLSGIEGGFYPVIFFEVTSLGESQGPTAISRLAVITLLQLANSPPADLTVAGLDIQQAGPGEAVGLFPIVTNRGKVHAAFYGYIRGYWRRRWCSHPAAGPAGDGSAGMQPPGAPLVAARETACRCIPSKCPSCS